MSPPLSLCAGGFAAPKGALNKSRNTHWGPNEKAAYDKMMVSLAEQLKVSKEAKKEFFKTKTQAQKDKAG